MFRTSNTSSFPTRSEGHKQTHNAHCSREQSTTRTISFSLRARKWRNARIKKGKGRGRRCGGWGQTLRCGVALRSFSFQASGLCSVLSTPTFCFLGFIVFVIVPAPREEGRRTGRKNRRQRGAEQLSQPQSGREWRLFRRTEHSCTQKWRLPVVKWMRGLCGEMDERVVW